MTIIRKPRIGTIRNLTDLPPGQSAVLDTGADLPRLVHRREDGSVVQTAEEARIAELERQLAEVQASQSKPRVGVNVSVPSVERTAEPYGVWTPVPVEGLSNAVGDWGRPNPDGWVTMPLAGTFLVSVSFTMNLIDNNGFLLLMYNDSNAEKFRVIESNGYGIQGGTAAGVINVVQGEKIRLLFATGGRATLVNWATRWSIREMGA